MNDLQLVIFDCDGVLVDSEVISNEVLAAALSAEGLPTTLREARRDYQGLLLADVASSAQEKLGRALPDDWLERYERERNEAFRRQLEPVAGAADAVRRIKAAGVSVCVASQGKHEKIQLTLELTGLRELFGESALFSAYSVARGKPHPDLFLHAAAAMNATPERSVVVEDTASGVLAAVAAGMRVFGYAADADEQALRREGAEILLSLDELPARLGL
ncbi:MAG TPA: HAD family hydrolase [Solirubrobacteraceae bacterium]